MIIRSIFRRYERWNPVHPTSGAFWGVGIGIGCGVGWGPGFGPEVIGYVGAGCGAGFSVGITFLGIGIGLPANHLFQAAQSASMVVRRGASEISGSRFWLGRSDVGGDNWCGENSSLLKMGNWTEFMPNMRSLLVSKSRNVADHMQRISKQLFPPEQGSER